MGGFLETITNNKLASTLLTATILGCLTFFYNHFEAYGETREIVQDEEHGLVVCMEETEEKISSIEKENQQAVQVLERISKQLARIERKQDNPPVPPGRATVCNCGPHDSFIEINRRGHAQLYNRENLRVRITYLDREGIEHTATLPVRKGGFINNDPGHLFMFSIKAAQDLGLEGIIRGVVLSPALENE